MIHRNSPVPRVSHPDHRGDPGGVGGADGDQPVTEELRLRCLPGGERHLVGSAGLCQRPEQLGGAGPVLHADVRGDRR